MISLGRTVAIVTGALLIAVAVPTSAIATTNVQVVNEATNTACSAISSPHQSGGCSIHAVVEPLVIQGWAFVWFDEANCEGEYQMRVSGTGVTAIDKLVLRPGDLNCSDTFTCDAPWEGKFERVSSTNFHWTSPICFYNPEIGTCSGTAEIDIVEGGTSNAETYSFAYVNELVGSICRVNASFKVEKPNGNDSPVHFN